MKKCIKIISALLVLSIALAGCGNRTSGDKDGTTEITWYMIKAFSDVKEAAQLEVEDAANKIIAKSLDAKVKFKLIDSASWEDKMKLMAASGDPYDLVLTSNWTNKLSTNVDRGAFMPLDDLIEKYGKTIKAEVDERAWKAATFDGKIMAVPSQGAYAPGASFVFKKDLVEKYGFDYKNAHTLRDIEPYLETIKKNEKGITPLLATQNGTPGSGCDYLTNIGGGVCYDEKRQEVVLGNEREEYNENARIVHEFYKKGYIEKDAAIKKDFMSAAKSGKYAVLGNSGAYSEDGSKATSAYGYDCVESLISYPYITTDNMIGAATAISSTSKHPEKAMQLLDLVWSDDLLLNTMAYGIEGKNFDYVSGKGTDNPKVKVYSGSKQVWGIWHNFLGPLWHQWDSDWNSKEALEAMQKANNEAQASGLLGFTFDITPVKSYYTQISALSNEARPIIQTGSMQDFDAYMKEFNAKLKAAHVDDIKAEIIRQIEEWRKNN